MNVEDVLKLLDEVYKKVFVRPREEGVELCIYVNRDVYQAISASGHHSVKNSLEVDLDMNRKLFKCPLYIVDFPGHPKVVVAEIVE